MYDYSARTRKTNVAKYWLYIATELIVSERDVSPGVSTGKQTPIKQKPKWLLVKKILTALCERP